MAKLIFKFSAMGAGKSVDALKTVHNYQEQGKRVLLMSSHFDNRYGVGKVTSRMGVSKESVIIGDNTNIRNFVEKELAKDPTRVFLIVIDEAQFLEEHHVLELRRIVDELGIPVICYGLRTNFKGNLFGGSEALFRFSDEFEKIKVPCTQPECNKSAEMVVRLSDGEPVFDGEAIKIGGDSMYKSVCFKHYFTMRGK